MNVLAFDTSTDSLSIALATPAGVLEHTGEGGARASAVLIPALMELLGRAGTPLRSLDAIAFGCGPGSFTGLRTACSVAQGLALGAGVPVLPIETLMAVAEAARHGMGAAQVLAVLDARMGEVYAAHYTHQSGRWHRHGVIQVAAPEALAPAPGLVIAGNAIAAYGQRLPTGGGHFPALPTAAALLRLAPALLAAGEARPAHAALPLYVRDKVAQTTLERAARAASALQEKMPT